MMNYTCKSLLLVEVSAAAAQAVVGIRGTEVQPNPMPTLRTIRTVATLVFVGLAAHSPTANEAASATESRREIRVPSAPSSVQITAPATDQVFQDQWRWAHFTVDSGLPSNNVLDVVETPAGTVWASTGGGVAWFDEYRWHPMGTEQGLPGREPHAIAPRGDDQLWVVVDRALYVGNKSGFRHAPVNVDGNDLRVRGVVAAGASGALLLAGNTGETDNSLYLYDDGSIAPLELPAALPWGTESSLAWGRDTGAVWVNTMAGLYHREDGRWINRLATPVSNPLGIAVLVEGTDGSGLASITYPNEYRGLWQWQAGGAPQPLAQEPRHLLQSMDIGPDQEVIAVYRSGDVRVRSAGRWWAVSPVPPQMNTAMAVRYRANGDLWVGTQRGLSLLHRSADRWTYWKADSPDGRNEISEILRTRDGSTWLATGNGVGVRNASGETTWTQNVLGTELGLVTGLAEDENGHVWISSGSGFEGAFRFDGERWRHYGPDQGLDAPQVHRIRKDRTGRLWFLGIGASQGREPRREPGAFAYDGRTFERWSTEEGLLAGRVYDFAEAGDGALWFATVSGLSRWKSGEWTHWTMEDGLHNARIFTVAVDRDDRLWFGDQHNGLGFLDNDVPRYLTTVDGLINDEVQDLKIDAAGALWVATRGGLACYHDGSWLSFDTSTGLNNPNLWPILPDDGRIYVGTSGSGVNVLSLKETDRPPPLVVIEEPVVEERATLLRWRAYSYRGMQSPAEIETRYRVDDDDWSDWTMRHETTLASMAPGDHIVEVQAKGLFGAFESTTVAATVMIPPPLYGRPGFIVPVAALTLVVVVLLGTIIARRHRHTLALRRSEHNYRRQLEQRVDERTEALRESEERLRLLLETTNVIPWEADATTWKFTYVGPQAVDILGYPIERWYEPDFWTSHIHPDDVDFAVGYCVDHAGSDLDYQFEYRMIAADGTIVWLDDLVSVVSEEGQATALRGFMIDITARKRADAERRVAESEAIENRERLAHMSRVNMLGELATGIAHEVNQPLTAVSTYTQASRRMIEAGAIDRDELLDVLGRISDEAVRAGEMIHRLKALVRKRPSEREICDVNELVADVMRLADIEARDRDVGIELDLDESLPQVWVDSVQIQQVILNLVRNAIEAVETDDNGRHTVQITTRSTPGAAIEVSVTDTGSGVAEADAERLFEPFFSTKGSGMGMGLSISRTIVEAHEGRIGYRGNDTGGSTFFFTLATDEGASEPR